jgi:outer membrane protein OmpA-like peptidoglycan-associated protein
MAHLPRNGSRALLTIGWLLGVALALGACKQAPDLTKYKEQATQLAAQWLPKLGDLAGTVEQLAGRAKALPVELPGVGEVTKLLDTHRGTLESLKGMLGSLPSQITGKPDQVTGLLAASTTRLETSAKEITESLATASGRVGELEAAAKAAAAPPPAPASDLSMKLDTGFEVKGAADGIEGQLLAFIQDASKPVDKTTWFNFDRLTFQEGKVELDVERSAAQLTNVVEILKAFPATKLKIGGYTDSTGSAEANQKVSAQRADTVKRALVTAGIAAARLESEGYGPDHPVCPANDTDECKAKNRRIAVRVTAK